MANVARIMGFKPVQHVSGAPWSGRVTRYFIPSTDGTAVYKGDVVKLAGSADTDGTTPTVQLASAGDSICGIVVGFAADPTNLNLSGTYRAANTNRYVLVADSPDLIFEVDTSNGTPAAVDVGLNINHATGSPSTTTGFSGAYADVGTKAATSTLTFRIVRFSARVDNEVAASAKLLVAVNKHQLAPGGQYDTGATAVIGTLGT